MHQGEQHARKLEDEATQTVLEMEIRTEAMLEEQRRGIINHANYELNMQENKAVSTVQNLEQQLRQQ